MEKILKNFAWYMSEIFWGNIMRQLVLFISFFFILVSFVIPKASSPLLAILFLILVSIGFICHILIDVTDIFEDFIEEKKRKKGE